MALGLLAASIAAIAWTAKTDYRALLIRIQYGAEIERTALRFLAELGTDRCIEAFGAAHIPASRAAEICPREAGRPVANLRIVGYSIDRDGLRVEFLFDDTNIAAQSELFVWLRNETGGWQVRGYARSY